MLDVVAVGFALVSLVTPWLISIPPAHLPQTFGFEMAPALLAAAGIVASLALEVRIAAYTLVLTEVVLVGTFGWAMWIVTTPRFTRLDFPFMATDLLGFGWYAAALALFAAAGGVVSEMDRRDLPLDKGLWLLSAIPGFGIARLGRWRSGLVWTALVSASVYLASTNSPDWAQLSENVPSAYPRTAEWVLLALAAGFWVTSIASTAWQRRRLQTELSSD